MPVITNTVLEHKIIHFSADVVTGVMVIRVARGYSDNGVFVQLDSNDVAIEPAVAYNLFNTPGVSTLSIYDQVKLALYNHLLDSGVVTGTLN
jgi:hypothetical protein